MPRESSARNGGSSKHRHPAAVATIERRLKEARLPRIKTLEEFDFAESKKVSAAEIAQLAKGEYIDRSEPVLLIGDCGTGKTYLMMWRLVGRSEGYGSPRQRRWSTNWSRPSNNCS